MNKTSKLDTNERSSTLLWTDLFTNKKCVDLIAQIYNFPVAEMRRVKKLFTKSITQSIRLSGLKWTCQGLKTLERSILLGTPFPVSIPGLRKFLRFSTNEKITLSYLSVHRNMYDEPKLDLRTIKCKLKQKTIDSIAGMDEDLEKVLHHRFFAIEEFGRIFYKKNTRLKTYMNREDDNPYACDPTIDTNGRTGGDLYPIQISFTKRANGSCFDSHTKDFHALTTCHRQLFRPLKRVWREWNYKLRKSSFNSCKHPCKVLGKVIPIRDKSCKTRVIAIFDSLSQIALRPVHKMLEDVLGNIPTDFTHNHLDGVKYLQKISKGRECFSVDIKSATDTIPMILSKKILSILINSKVVKDPSTFVDDIFAILTDRTFHLENGSTVRYGVGQPMGAYASFPLLAITNHVMVQIAAVRAGIPLVKGFFYYYAVVGDDVVICNREVAKQYYLLLEELDIPISKHKCLSMMDSFEFCHRVVVNGVLRSIPSWNSYARALLSKDPTPVMNLCSDYSVVLKFSTLCNFFLRRYIRTACAFREYLFPDLPNGRLAVELIPANVIGHAVRSLEIRDILRKKNNEPIETDDKFLNRLNYCIKIQTMFRDQSKIKVKPCLVDITPLDTFNKKVIKKDGLDINTLDITLCDRKYITVKTSKEVWRKLKIKSVWEIAHKVIANTFYLNYINNFLDRKRLYRHSFSTSRGPTGSSLKLRSYCMSQRNKWIDDRLLSPVSQDKVIQTKAFFPSGLK